MRIGTTLACVLLVGCATNSGPDYIPGFNPPAVDSGYTRFVTPTVTNIAPGADVEYCQWIAGPSDTDRDVLDVKGLQSKTGHHAVLYATTETKFKVGESHICTVDDMLSISFLGGIGGEGTGASAAKLPDGLYFRLPKGTALMANTHWLNATDSTVDGQAVLDVKFAPATSDHVVADIFANNGDTFQVMPGTTTSYDNSCVLKQDLSFAMVTNHMHTLGTSAYTELVHPDGTKQMIVSDPVWSPEEQFDPMYARFTVAQPLVAHAGDTIHTHCEWANSGTKTISFPDEMCVGIGFYFPATSQIACEDGSWPSK